MRVAFLVLKSFCHLFFQSCTLSILFELFNFSYKLQKYFFRLTKFKVLVITKIMSQYFMILWGNKSSQPKTTCRRLRGLGRKNGWYYSSVTRAGRREGREQERSNARKETFKRLKRTIEIKYKTLLIIVFQWLAITVDRFHVRHLFWFLWVTAQYFGDKKYR